MDYQDVVPSTVRRKKARDEKIPPIILRENRNRWKRERHSSKRVL